MLADLGPQLEVGNMFSVAGKNVLVRAPTHNGQP